MLGAVNADILEHPQQQVSFDKGNTGVKGLIVLFELQTPRVREVKKLFVPWSRQHNQSIPTFLVDCSGCLRLLVVLPSLSPFDKNSSQ